MSLVQKALSGLQKAGADRRPVIGCFPLYPPLPLLHALGLRPVTLWGLAPQVRTFARSDRHLQPYACSVARRLLEFALSDEGAVFDAFLAYNACDTLRNLPEIMAAGLEEAGRPRPVITWHLPQVPQGVGRARDLFRHNLESLVAGLSDRFGCSLRPGALEESFALFSEAQALCRALEGAVAEGRMSFNRFQDLVLAGSFLAVEDFIRELKEALAGLPEVKPAASGLRVILSGILPPPEPVTRALEEAGITVAGNDIAALSRTYRAEPGAGSDPDSALWPFYRDRFPCTTLLYLADGRPGALLDLIRERGADGFVFVGEKFCEYEYFEMPYLENRFREAGISTLFLEIAADDLENVDAQRTRIEAFAESL